MAAAVSAWESCGGVSMVRQNAAAPRGEEVESGGDERRDQNGQGKAAHDHPRGLERVEDVLFLVPVQW